MKLAYIRWKDAVAEEAGDTGTYAAEAKLAELQEVGFLLDENEEAVVIGKPITIPVRALNSRGDSTTSG